jgi:hypothetical protein
MVIQRHSKQPKRKLSNDERKYVWDLRNNKYINILKSKGNTTIIMNTKDYLNKLMEHITCRNYRIINKDYGNKLMCVVFILIKY